MQTTTHRFTTDNFAAEYEAIAYGEPWNGWVTPIVTRATLEAIESAESNEGEWFSVDFADDGTATFLDKGSPDSDVYTYTLAVSADGGYDLGMLGWCFETVPMSATAALEYDTAPSQILDYIGMETWAKVGQRGDAFTICWTDGVTGEWCETYPTLSAVMARFAALAYCGESQWEKAFESRSHFDAKAAEFFESVTSA